MPNVTETGQFILTGSQNILLAQGVTESLAGRTAMLRLLPLSYREMLGVPQAPLPWEEGPRPPRQGLAYHGTVAELSSRRIP